LTDVYLAQFAVADEFLLSGFKISDLNKLFPCEARIYKIKELQPSLSVIAPAADSCGPASPSCQLA
jgi:hypothetical protein